MFGLRINNKLENECLKSGQGLSEGHCLRIGPRVPLDQGSDGATCRLFLAARIARPASPRRYLVPSGTVEPREHTGSTRPISLITRPSTARVAKLSWIVHRSCIWLSITSYLGDLVLFATRTASLDARSGSTLISANCMRYSLCSFGLERSLVPVIMT